MDGDDAPLQPVDPSVTGDCERSAAVRDALKRKRGDGEDGDVDGAWVPPTAAASKTCVHEVALPPGAASVADSVGLLQPRYDGPPAKTYPFTLDPFQQTAVACLVRVPVASAARRLRAVASCCDSLTLVVQERRESVLVAAHTSAGKTVVAECVCVDSG
jgi:hypothetical protein